MTLSMSDRPAILNKIGAAGREFERTIHEALRAGYTPAEIREYVRPNSQVVADGLMEEIILEAEIVEEP